MTPSLIDKLTELRKKLQEWNNGHENEWSVDETFGGDAVIFRQHDIEGGKGVEVLFEADWGTKEDAEYIIALHQAFPLIKQHFEAVERFVEAVESLDLTSWSTYVGEDPDKQWNDCNAAWKHEIKHWLHIYREAVNNVTE